jgi:hypothetical protein
MGKMPMLGAWEAADRASAGQLADSRSVERTFAAMDTRWQPHLDQPLDPERLSAEARGLFASGWYAMRDECRLVHPGEQREQLVSHHVWRELRDLAAHVPTRVLVQES